MLYTGARSYSAILEHQSRIYVFMPNIEVVRKYKNSHCKSYTETSNTDYWPPCRG